MKATDIRAAAAFLLFFVTACTGGRSIVLGSDAAEAPDSGTVSTDGGAADASADAAVFEHEVLTYEVGEAKTGIATGDFNTPSLSYPALAVDPKLKHALTFEMSPFLPPLLKSKATSGPLVLYSDDMDVLVFSPLDHFFESLVWLENDEIRHGVEGDMDELPAGFTHRFVVVKGKGIRATLDRFGDVLRADRGRARADRYADRGLSHIGYWTDNGAYYYYKTKEGMNYEDTLLAVESDADARGIPYGYFQLDSWWYFKEGTGGVLGGLVRWEPIPQMFPEGLAAFRDRLGLPLVAHNRWFAKENDYRGRYPFTEGKDMSLPLDRGPYDEFMQNAAAWGIFTYEQDWLMNQFQGVPHLREGAGNAARWMRDLNDAAAAQGLTIQLCMPGAAHLLSAVDLPVVTTSRTSMDYHRDVCKECFWPQFHTVNLLAWAAGVLPFKDNFQSAEDHAEAEALVSALSAGMVGLGDKVGDADAALISRTCRQDGLILKPERPAYPLDAMFLPHKRPYTVATHSTSPAGTWTYLAAFHLASGHPERTIEDENYALFAYSGLPLGEMFVHPKKVSDWDVDLPADLGIADKAVLYDWRTGEAEVVEGRFEIPKIEHLYDHAYFVLAPIFENGLALLGETQKFITMADKRFVSVVPEADSVRVTLSGVPGETVTLKAYDTRARQMLEPVTVTIAPDGTTEADLSR
ncbi:MAG: hypothetical protein HY897_15720 [Deltaproteobacteria bacterium]|nr:hypothetical protein [Deltaproteobacteria bacterium]